MTTPTESGANEKPTRSGRLTLVFVIGGSVAAALLVAVGFFVGLDRAHDSAVHAFESRVGSLDTAAYEIPDVPDEENAAHWFREAGDALILEEADRGILAVHTVAAGETAVEDRAAALPVILAKNRKAIEFAERGAACDRSKYGPMPDTGIADQTLLGHLLVGRARRAAAVGEGATELSTLRTLGALAAALYAEPEQLRLLIGLGVESYQLSLISARLSRPELDAVTCRSLSGLVLKRDLAGVFVRSLGLEGATFFQSYQRAFRMPRGEGGLPDPRAGVFNRLVRHSMITNQLRAMVDAAETIDLTCPEMRRELDRRRRRLGPDWALTYSRLACRVKEQTARRQLILLALEVRKRASEGTPYSGILSDIPGAGDGNALTGSHAESILRPDGSLVLSYRIDEEERRRLCPSCDPEPRGLEVVLPPARQGAPPSARTDRSDFRGARKPLSQAGPAEYSPAQPTSADAT